MRSHIFISVLTIALAVVTPIVGTFVFSELAVAQPIEQRKEEADRLLQKGIEQYELSQFERAFQSLQQAIIIYRKIKNRHGEEIVLGNFGIAYFKLGNYAKAIDYHEDSLAISREIKDSKIEAQSLIYLGNSQYAIEPI
jgi:tetratricopeptide (TPR) repeat protein